MKNFDLENENGRSMIEMLGVLAIIGVLSVGGIAGYSKAMMKYRINKTIEQITLVAGNVRAFFGPQKNYKNLVSCSDCTFYDTRIDGFNIIQKAKLVPDEMQTLTGGKLTVITNSFGGEFELSGVNKSSESDGQAFYFWLRDIPEEACIELVSQDWTASGVKGISIMNKDEDWSYLKVPAAVDDVVTACTKSEFVRFYFDIDLNSTLWNSITWN